LQSREQRYKEKAQDAKRKLAEVTNSEDPPHGGSHRKKRQISVHGDIETEEISRIAKAFTVMHILWLRSDKATFHTTLDQQYDHLKRFDSIEDKIQGQVSDIQAVLSSKYTDVMVDSEVTWLSQTVSGYYTYFSCV
jgi:hypothetical protein